MNAAELGKAAAKVDARESLAIRRAPDYETPEFGVPNPWRHEALEAYGVDVDQGTIDPDDNEAKRAFVEAYVAHMLRVVGDR